jgi:hypothetical protein
MIERVLNTEREGKVSIMNWSMNDQMGYFQHASGVKLSYKHMDGASYLAGRELITRASLPGRLGASDGAKALHNCCPFASP